METIKKIDASSSLIGYIYQSYYALFLLLNSKDNTEVAIEKFDDVALIEKNKIIRVAETKHHKDDNSKLTNSSIDFWKTLGNWSEAYLKNQLRPAETMLTIITTQKISDSSIFIHLRPENRDISEVLKTVNSLAEKKGTNLEEHYKKFNELDEYQKFTLLNNIIIIDSHPKIEELKKIIISRLEYSVIPNRINELYNELVGWWWEKIIPRITGTINTNLLKSEVKAKITDISQKYTNDNLPIYFDETSIEDNDLPDDSRTFVKQLEWISIGPKMKRHAKSDYYLASEHRSKWIRNELLFFDELNKFDNSLKIEWKRKFDQMSESIGDTTHENTKQMKGRELLNWANDGTDNLCIRPLCKSPFVRRGTFQILSNKEQIGWHHDFEKKIQELKQDESN